MVSLTHMCEMDTQMLSNLCKVNMKGYFYVRHKPYWTILIHVLDMLMNNISMKSNEMT